MPKLWPRIYYFVSGLLYPGALGTALVWLVQAVFAVIDPSLVHPTAWSITFAVWFTVYHSLLFVRLMDRYDVWCSDPVKHPTAAYGLKSLISDVLDSIAMFLAFGALGFQPDRVVTPFQSGWLFIAAGLVPVSALIALKGWPGRLRGALIGVALIMCIIGSISNLNGAASARLNWILLALLLIGLLIYSTWLYQDEDASASRSATANHA
jgi:hypothetical protein